MAGMIEKVESLRGAVRYGIENGKKNMIVDLDCLDFLFAGEAPVGNSDLAPQEITERLYLVKARDAALLHACLAAVGFLAGQSILTKEQLQTTLVHAIKLSEVV